MALGGHIDSWDVGQGAHDDGGGSVISMEALRLMKQLGLRLRRTVRVVPWVNEENGLKGGRAYRDSLGDDVKNHVVAIESDGGVERPEGFVVTMVIAKGDTVAGRARQHRAVERVRQIAALLAGIGASDVAAMAVMAYVLADMPGRLGE